MAFTKSLVDLLDWSVKLERLFVLFKGGMQASIVFWKEALGESAHRYGLSSSAWKKIFVPDYVKYVTKLIY